MTTASISNVNTYFTSLITQLMTVERQPLQTLQSRRSELQAKGAVFSDLGAKLSSLRAVVDKFASTALTSVFDKRAVTISDQPTGKTVLTATASSTATAGVYNIADIVLAKEHRVRSDQQTYADQALNFSGTFVIGGAASRSQTTTSTIANTVTAFDVASIASGQKELGKGAYYVETRNDATSGWQFRMVDADGKAVSVKSGSTTDYTSNWQSIPTGGGSYNTGRGLTITFGADSGQYTAASKGAGAAQLSYTAQGASITVAATHTLNDIASAINGATFASGDTVTASVVDKQLVLAANETGATHSITASDTSGTVLQTLGVLTGAGAFKNVMQTASNATFSVNGLSVTRSKHTGLDDVITGVTLNFASDAASQTAKITVARDNAAVRSEAGDWLNKVNSLNTYLADKTGVTGDGSTTATAKYTRGVLADDYSYTTLRSDLIDDLTNRYSGLPAGSATTLAQIGITLDENLQMTISDTSKFDTALTNDSAGVKALLAKVADRMTLTLNGMTDATSGTLTSSKKAITDEISNINDQITFMEERLTDRESALRDQYAVLQSQVIGNIYLQQQLSSFGGFNFYG